MNNDGDTGILQESVSLVLQESKMDIFSNKISTVNIHAGQDIDAQHDESTWTQAVILPQFTLIDPEKQPITDPFPIKSMTPIFAACLRYMSRRSGVSDGLIVGPFLANVSAAFLPSVTVRTDYGKVVGINIYAQTNAPPSSRKSDMQNPIQRLLEHHDGKRRKQLSAMNERRNREKEVWKVKANALKKQLVEASKKLAHEDCNRLEQELLVHLEKEPVFLPDLCIVQGDVTPAAIIQSLHDNQGCSTLLIDEGILLYQKILNIEIHQINSAWSGAALNKTTIRGGNLYIEKPRPTIHAFLQNDIFAKFGRGKSFDLLKDSGFFSRLLICEPKVGPEENEFPEFTGSETALEQLLSHLNEQLATNYPLVGLFSGTPRTLTLTDDAERLVQEYYQALQLASQVGGIYAELPALCGKASEHVHRIAGILHCIEQHETTEINFNVASAAIQLFDWYLLEHWRLIVKQGRPLNVEMASEKLIHWMRHRHDRYDVRWISRSDIPRHVECFRDNPDLLDDVIRYLVQKKDIATTSGRRKGRRGGYRYHEISFTEQFEKYEKYLDKTSV